MREPATAAGYALFRKISALHTMSRELFFIS